jgi:hypothetical protein
MRFVVCAFALIAAACSGKAESQPDPVPADAGGCSYDTCLRDCDARCPITCNPGDTDCRGTCQKGCPSLCRLFCGDQ